MSFEKNSDGSVTVTGEKHVRAASAIALRGALRLECRGMKRHGRPATVIANEQMGTSIRSRNAVYDAFNTWAVREFGIPDRPRTW